jgi:hypothetical protein
MHRFTPAVPLSEVTKHVGWVGVQEDIKEVAIAYERPICDSSMEGYCFVVADYLP